MSRRAFEYSPDRSGLAAGRFCVLRLDELIDEDVRDATALIDTSKIFSDEDHLREVLGLTIDDQFDLEESHVSKRQTISSPPLWRCESSAAPRCVKSAKRASRW